MKTTAHTISPEDAFTYLGLRRVSNTFGSIPAPFSETDNLSGTHLVVAYPGISLNWLAGLLEAKLGRKDDRGFLYSLEEAWYNNHPIGDQRWDAGWYLIPVEKMLQPSVAIVAYGLIVHALKTGEKLFTKDLVPCFEMDAYGKHACIQYHKLGLYVTWDPRIQLHR